MGSSSSHIEDIYKSLETNFKCISCSYYLSCSPLKISSTNGALMCGRCQEVGYVQSEHLYNIFKDLKFPCNYHTKGCNVTTKFDDRNHETECKYLIYRECPTGLLCDWNGSGFDVLDHFKKVHPTLLLKDSQFDLPEIISSKTYLYEKGKTLVLFSFKFDSLSSIFRFKISYFNSKNEIPSDYNLEFSSKTSNHKVIINTFNKCKPYSTSTEDFIVYDMNLHNPGLGYSSKITVKVNFKS